MSALDGPGEAAFYQQVVRCLEHGPPGLLTASVPVSAVRSTPAGAIGAGPAAAGGPPGVASHAILLTRQPIPAID